jgi:hypothetical protein
MKKSHSIALTAILIFAAYSAVTKTILAEAEMQQSSVPAKIKVIHPEVLRIPASEVKELLAKK